MADGVLVGCSVVSGTLVAGESVTVGAEGSLVGAGVLTVGNSGHREGCSGAKVEMMDALVGQDDSGRPGHAS